ncbi:hypothetical protein AVEN_43149-1 [Araneus ventricosus]|uniref:Uncharacterized protein n=1 Tax=Araneus ventricosus TaxID=182803 RepID=A0A4Y2LX83_ARAVE|nr:hypothetical protein AVEN_43149-1 [Araneus ventricosus]
MTRAVDLYFVQTYVTQLHICYVSQIDEKVEPLFQMTLCSKYPPSIIYTPLSALKSLVHGLKALYKEDFVPFRITASSNRGNGKGHSSNVKTSSSSYDCFVI